MESATIDRAPMGQLATSPDGDIYDPQTGEVYGVIDPISGVEVWIKGWEGQPEEKEPFRIRNREAADWVLRLFMGEANAILAIEREKAALLANLEGRSVRHRNKIKGLEWRFKRELEEFAREQLTLPGAKGKSLLLTWGKLIFRISRGRSEITDMPKAIEFVDEWAPTHVKKSVGIEAVQAALANYRESTEADIDHSEFFIEGQPQETFSIDTGIKN